MAGVLLIFLFYLVFVCLVFWSTERCPGAGAMSPDRADQERQGEPAFW